MPDIVEVLMEDVPAGFGIDMKEAHDIYDGLRVLCGLSPEEEFVDIIATTLAIAQAENRPDSFHDDVNQQIKARLCAKLDRAGIAWK